MRLFFPKKINLSGLCSLCEHYRFCHAPSPCRTVSTSPIYESRVTCNLYHTSYPFFQYANDTRSMRLERLPELLYAINLDLFDGEENGRRKKGERFLRPNRTLYTRSCLSPPPIIVDPLSALLCVAASRSSLLLLLGQASLVIVFVLSCPSQPLASP